MPCRPHKWAARFSVHREAECQKGYNSGPMLDPIFTRRDFLKLSAAGMLGAFLAEAGIDSALALASNGRVSSAPVRQGRMTQSGWPLLKDPAFNAQTMQALRADELVTVMAEVQGDAGNPYNNRWYQLEGGGFTYSGWVQPVETHYQLPQFDIPQAGRPGEVTVPWTLTRREPDRNARHSYRAYYATTYWVKSARVNPYEKSLWYQIYDEHLHDTLYIAASDLRLIPYEELSQLSPDIPNDRKRLHVDTATQSVTAFEDDNAVMMFRAATGQDGTTTPLGEFQTYHKGPSIHMTNDGAADAGRGYDLPGVPWVSFFTGTGVSFHGTYWHNDYGRARSHGCVNLRPEDSKWVYRWTNPVVAVNVSYLHMPKSGTRVTVA